MCSSMKSRMRSRSVSTWGLGVKSMYSVPLLGAGPRTLAARRLATPVAGEELAVLLQQPGELQLGRARQRPALEDARRVATGHPRRGGEEELVDDAGCPELAVQVRSALAEHRADVVLAAQMAQGGDEVDAVVVADDVHARCRLRRLGLRGGEDQHPAALVEERRVPGKVEATADQHHQRLRMNAEALAALARL